MNRLLDRIVELLDRIPASLVALFARVGIGATFWLSGQTKIEGLVLDPIGLHAQFGWPRVSEGALELFRSEYALPLLPPELAANLAAFSEHLFPLMLLLGLGTRFAALALLGMTAVIEVFVYPDAWPTHAVWAACLLYLVARGPGVVSLDHWLGRRSR
jgi:putative oxidoreductase